MSVSSRQIFERVVKGAAFLDKKVPGWEYKVMLGDLDVLDARHCPLAYVIGGNWAEKVTVESAKQYGLYAQYLGEAEKLNEFWRSEITKRRVASRM